MNYASNNSKALLVKMVVTKSKLFVLGYITPVYLNQLGFSFQNISFYIAFISLTQLVLNYFSSFLVDRNDVVKIFIINSLFLFFCNILWIFIFNEKLGAFLLGTINTLAAMQMIFIVKIGKQEIENDKVMSFLSTEGMISNSITIALPALLGLMVLDKEVSIIIPSTLLIVAVMDIVLLTITKFKRTEKTGNKSILDFSHMKEVFRIKPMFWFLKFGFFFNSFEAVFSFFLIKEVITRDDVSGFFITIVAIVGSVGQLIGSTYCKYIRIDLYKNRFFITFSITFLLSVSLYLDDIYLLSLSLLYVSIIKSISNLLFWESRHRLVQGKNYAKVSTSCSLIFRGGSAISMFIFPALILNSSPYVIIIFAVFMTILSFSKIEGMYEHQTQ
ncbi:MFS transporter [Photobacterium galatheae]|uniref:MFS transporter n=1 Tax=Photobacterium galatheae TaxID=1654360 RepID=A0A066RI57_9GAMM|nr:MFS transporter [Photobacterium galatheae]KDM90009.1 hypothetical protein EA58_18880 [Photobacterium galatheae]MCM0149990.1 MFS transporter [Photobacterium galatheae]